jgi:hypothetical protein
MSLSITQMSGFNSRRRISVEFICSGSSTADSVTYTFNSQNFGVEHYSRFIAVFAQTTGSGTAQVPTSMTIGGITASKIVDVGNQGFNTIGLWGAAVPTGTTGTIVIGVNPNSANMNFSAYAIYDASSNTVSETNTFVGGALVASASNISGTVGENVCLCAISSRNSSSYTWGTAVTEDYDFVVESSGCLSSASGLDTPVTVGSSNIAATGTGSGTERYIVARWK